MRQTSILMATLDPHNSFPTKKEGSSYAELRLGFSLLKLLSTPVSPILKANCTLNPRANWFFMAPLKPLSPSRPHPHSPHPQVTPFQPSWSPSAL